MHFHLGLHEGNGVTRTARKGDMSRQIGPAKLLTFACFLAINNTDQTVRQAPGFALQESLGRREGRSRQDCTAKLLAAEMLYV